MNALRPLVTGILIAACAVAAAQDCSSVAGNWEGTWSETDCYGDYYAGVWTGAITNDCVFTGGSAFGNITGSIDPLTGALTASDPSAECGLLTLTGTFQNDSAEGEWNYFFGGGGSFIGSRVLVDTDGDGDPDATDPDDDNDGIGDALDAEPLVSSNFCTSSDGNNATLGETVVAVRTCAARVSISVVSPTRVMGSGDLRLIAPTVRFQSGVEVAGELTVTSAHPCPACSP